LVEKKNKEKQRRKILTYGPRDIDNVSWAIFIFSSSVSSPCRLAIVVPHLWFLFLIFSSSSVIVVPVVHCLSSPCYTPWQHRLAAVTWGVLAYPGMGVSLQNLNTID
jgi:hypothetical protein